MFVGLSVRGRTRDLEAYLLAGRDLPWWAILGSIVATETSTATVLSVPGLAYGPAGMTFLQLAFGYIIGRAIVARVLLPLYFQGRLSSAYEVLGRRFGAGARQAASLIFLAARNVGDGLRLFLAALVIQQLAGWSFAASLVVMGGTTIVYTVLGGMRSVVWNDCLQLVIYVLGGVAALFIIAAQVPDGWPGVWAFAAREGKLSPFDWRLSWSEPFTIWSGAIGGAVLTIGTHGTDHMLVQRYLSARSQQDAGRALVASGVVVLLQFALFLFIGVELAAYYAAHPPASPFERTDQVFASFIVHAFPRNTGMAGLMLAAVLAAAMSTLSSSLNSSASAVVHDWWLPRRRAAIAPSRLLLTTQALTVAFGLVQMGIGGLATLWSSAVVDSALTVAGFSAGVLLGLFALGVRAQSVGQRAALTGAAVGGVMMVALHFGLPLAGASRLAYPWLALAGSATTFGAGWCAERLRRARENRIAGA